MLDVERLPVIYSNWRARYEERDERMGLIDDVVKGDFSIFDPDEEQVESRSPNLIQVALEDTSEAASLVPTIRVQPSGGSEEKKNKAYRMERIAAGYMEANGIDLMIPRVAMDFGAYGFSVLTVTPDLDQKIPLIERRNPHFCYPEPGFRPGDTVRRVMFAHDVYVTQLPEAYQDKLVNFIEMSDEFDRRVDLNQKLTIVEYYDEHEIVTVALYSLNPAGGFNDTKVGYLPIELDRIEHNFGVCPVVIGSRITLDGEMRGQFDQVIGLLEAQIRLMGLVIDYADQSVYSDIWVRDLIGEMPYGGGGYIELGPNGGIGRIPPAVSSLNVQQDIERLIEGIHLGGRWPKSRPGEIDQSIASAKFLEASAGMMNTTIRTYHQILQNMIQRVVRIAYIVDQKSFPGKKTTAGILRNQEFLLEYDSDRDIDLEARVRVEYGLGLGRDPAQSAVLHIQYSQNEYISKEFVQENIDGLTDVGREQARIDNEKFNAMAEAKLLQGIQDKSIPDRALIEMARDRAKGKSLMDVFEKYVVAPQEEIAQQMVPTGLGAPMLPGGPGQGQPGQPPAAPPGAQPPTPPAGNDLLARLGVPAGPGGTLGTQVMQQGGK